MELELSPLGHTWLFDLDGTILKHNGYKTDGKDTILEGVDQLFFDIPEGDMILFVTSRKLEEREQTEQFLRENHIRFDQIVYGLPYGERILVNDKKPSGLPTAIAINTERDCCVKLNIEVNEQL